MSEKPITTCQLLRYFKNEDGKKTLNTDVANKWIDSGSEVSAVLTDFEGTSDIEISSITSISFSMEERITILVTKGRGRYYFKKKVSGVRFIEIDHFEVIGEKTIEEKDPEKKRQEKEKKKKLSYAKDFVDLQKEVHAVYYESRDCKTTTAKIAKVNLEENFFETDTGVRYYLQ